MSQLSQSISNLLIQFPGTSSGKQGWPWTESSPPLAPTLPDGSPWPRISIVTPSFNQADYIEETIRSVLLQGYPNLEYFIMDGGSTDGSVDIIRKYEPWLTGWVSKQDHGQSSAINKGWSRATGEILAWINSDDYYASSALSDAAEMFHLSGPQTGLVHGVSVRINSDGCINGYAGKPFDLIEILPLAKSAVAQPSAFVRAAAVRSLGGVAEDLHLSMDWDLWNRIALNWETVFCPKVWSTIRFWSGAKTTQSIQGFGPEMLVSIQRLYQQKDIPPKILAIKRRALSAIAVRAAMGYYQAQKFDRMRDTFIFALLTHPIFAFRRAGRMSLRFLLG